MVYVCIPACNEAVTLGAVLWKTRKELSELGRDFVVVVGDDGSDDGTSELLERYRNHVPLTVLRSERRMGYARTAAKLLGWVARRSPYPKRDFAILLQADLTEDPAEMTAMIKKLEGGADLVASRPEPARGRESAGGRMLRRFLAADNACGRRFWGGLLDELPGDPFAGLRAYRVKVLADAFREFAGREPFRSDGWGADVEALWHFARHARRTAEQDTSLRPELRARRSRFSALRELLGLLRSRAALGTSRRMALRAGAVAVAMLTAATGAAAYASAQEATTGQEPETTGSEATFFDSLAARYPVSELAAAVAFGPGERLSYRVELGWFDVGEGRLSIEGLDEVRGNPTYRARLDIDGGKLGFKYKQEHTSFIDTETLQSHRYLRRTDQTGYQGERHYEMYSEEGEWRREDIEDSGPLGSSLPLDDISFIYYLRHMELEVGRTYTVPRYFKEEGNPVVIRVLRREKRKVDAGEFDCLVVQPVVQVEGMFAEGMEAEIYLTDDERRLIVYLRTDVPRLPGALELYLKDHRAGLPLNPDARRRALERVRPAETTSAG